MNPIDKIEADFDGDGKSSPWEKLCFWIIASCVAITFGMQLL
jgi:hypothetical protein